jgi:hypothetical protein
LDGRGDFWQEWIAVGGCDHQLEAPFNERIRLTNGLRWNVVTLRRHRDPLGAKS